MFVIDLKTNKLIKKEKENKLLLLVLLFTFELPFFFDFDLFFGLFFLLFATAKAAIELFESITSLTSSFLQKS